MKKYFFLLLFLGVGVARAQQDITLTSYSNQSEIKTGRSITLKEGFHIPAGNTVRIYIVPGFQDCVPFVSSPSATRNYISTKVFKVPGVTSWNLDNWKTCDLNQTIQYFDGLGRLVQTVQAKASPDLMDIVQPIVYDQYGREELKYLPYTLQSGTGAFQADAVSQQAVFYGQSSWASHVVKTAYPFGRTVFEPSPLNRVIEQGAAGTSWQPVTGNNTGHTAKIAYDVNVLDEVKLWRPNGSGASATYYDAGKLSKTITRDENWVPSDGKAGTNEEFKDFEGRIVLKRNWETDTKSLSTYYVYDDLGNLCYVLPPAVNEHTDKLTTPISSFTEADNVFKQYIYGYHYDGRKRQIEKKVPGKGWEWNVYGKRDELVLSQDSLQRAAGTWLFNKYDEKARSVMSGELSSALGRAAMQSAVNNYTGAVWEKYTGSGTYGYDNGSYPQIYSKVLMVNYYDRYDFTGNVFGNPTGGQRTDALSLQTGSLVNVLGSSSMLLSVSYYDDKTRLVQRKIQNHLGGTDIVDLVYNFADELLSSTRSHTANGTTTNIAESYTYDHMGRKLSTAQSINGTTPVTLSELVYNELGQLKEKRLHNGLQTTSYAYNERGWMKKASSPQFSFELKYDDGSVPQYNGNIANQHWGAGSSYLNAFSYGYDKLNRLNSGSSAGNTMSEVLTYDVMGNIATLDRDGAGLSTYNYTGNRLDNISGGGIATGNYGYDANGNAITDGRNGVTLTYNYLSLPVTTTKSGLSMSYSYDAAGNKLTRTSNGFVTQYSDGIQYKADGTIDFIQHEAGIARRNGSSYSYEYTLTDHLGNARYSFDVFGSAVRRIQQQDYYAFGKVGPGQYVSGEKNKYLYNSKELQEELGQLDYGARFYDPVIGRFNTVDPLSEKSRRFSSYSYAVNNPIRFIDVDGMYASLPPDIIFKGTDDKEIRIKADGADQRYNVPFALGSNQNLDLGLSGIDPNKFVLGSTVQVNAGFGFIAGADYAANLTTVQFTSNEFSGYNYVYAGVDGGMKLGAQASFAAGVGGSFFVGYNTSNTYDPTTFAGSSYSIGGSADIKGGIGGGWSLSAFSSTEDFSAPGWKGISIGMNVGVGVSGNFGSVDLRESKSVLLNDVKSTAQRSIGDRIMNAVAPQQSAIAEYIYRQFK